MQGSQPIGTRSEFASSEPDVQAAATTSMVLEIVFGLFSLLGIGHVYAGRVGLGLALMLGWWLYLLIAAGVSTITAGIAACLFVPIFLVVPIISGIQSSAYVKKIGATGSWRNVALVAGGGCLFVVIALCVLPALGIISISTITALWESL